MERTEKIQTIGGKVIEPILKERLTEIQNYFWDYRTPILEGFQKQIKLLCEKAYELQKNHQKEAIQFLSISYLRRCVYTKKYEIRMDLYNKNFYLDSCKIYEYWDMEFLFQFFEKDIDDVWKQIRSKNPPLFIQVQDYEEKEFALWYIKHYYKIAELFFQDQISNILQQEEFQLLKKEENYFVLYGGYMEEQKILFSSEGSSVK